MNSSTLESASFGPFCLHPRARVLSKSGVPVALGSRALDILIALVERAGEVVSQRELMSKAWRGLVVESGNLRVQITQLRRCLGDGEQGARYIANLPGQGYSFVAPVRFSVSSAHVRAIHTIAGNASATESSSELADPSAGRSFDSEVGRSSREARTP